MDRRQFIQSSAIIGCSAAASPLMTPMAFAAVPSEQRMVVILLRGGMDGLDVVQPYGDKALKAMRPGFKIGPAQGHIALNNMFALNKGLASLMPLWKAGDLAFAHAVSTPYRDKRSHFDGQDLLEAGTGPRLPLPANQSGWLNRMIQTFPKITSDTGYVLGTDPGLIFNGNNKFSAWNAGTDIKLSNTGMELLRSVCARDKLFLYAIERANAIASADKMKYGNADIVANAQFAANRLKGASRIVAFSVNGWDMHAGQNESMPESLSRLSSAILTLKNGLGPIWNKTTIFAMTEFGRTARANGSGGTDHGTGGAMLIAGGTLKGKSVHGKWPGLANLYADRDLMPTVDVRTYPAWAMHKLYGISKSTIESNIFPGLSMGADPGFLA